MKTRKSMVRMLILAFVCVSFVLIGCAGLQTAQDKVCNAPASVLSMIDGAILVAEMAAAEFIPGSAPYIAAVSSYATAASIKDGLCVSLTQLNNLIAFLQSPDAKKIQAKTMVKAGPAKAKVLNIQPLIDWKGTFK